MRALRTNVASVSDPKTGVTRKATIETVIENRADPNYVRRNILTKGAIIICACGHVSLCPTYGEGSGQRWPGLG